MFTKSLWDKLVNHRLVQSITDNYNKIKHNIQNTINITPLLNRIYHIDYPQQHHLKILAAHIGQNQYQIWNLSQYSYEKQLTDKLLVLCPKGSIKHLCYEMYTNSPFLQLLQAIDQIHTFLIKNKQAKVYLHCQQSRMRSAVFLSCYIYKHKSQNINCISDAIIKINKQLNVSLQSNNMNDGNKGKYANHHLLIRNFVNYQTNSQFINHYHMQIKKIIMVNPPHLRRHKHKVDVVGWQQTKVHGELRCAQRLVWKGIAQIVNNTLVWVVDVEVSDQFLIVVKYVIGKQMYRMLRIQLNSNFIFEQNAIIQQNNIDLSTYVATTQKIIQIKLDLNKLNHLSKLALKAVQKQTKKQQMIKQEKQNRVEMKQQGNEHKFTVQNYEDNNEQQDEDLQMRIQQVMRGMQQRKLREQAQAQGEQIDIDDVDVDDVDVDVDEQDEERIDILQMGEQSSPTTMPDRSQHKMTVGLSNQQQPILPALSANKSQIIKFQQPVVQSNSSQQQQDLQDYLKKLQSQAV